MSLKARVKYRMSELGLNPAQVSKAAGFAPTFIRDLMDGRKQSVRSDSLQKLADALEVTPEWLNGEGPLEGSAGAVAKTVYRDEIHSVPIFDIRASAGPGSLAEDGEPIGYQPYRAQELERITRADISNLAVIRVAGDSMEPTLSNADQVLVDLTVARIGRDGLYILAVDEDLLVKRCQVDLETGAVIVISDNSAYETIRVTDRDRLNVLGRVVWLGRVLG
jgi:phage repressor protein C with HTH and peptisase S24 domain